MASYLSGFTHLEIPLEEIKIATNNFHHSKVIGVGGFGKVYEGELSLPEGKHMAAFKRLDSRSDQGIPEFIKEIRMLSHYKHTNLISLLGFCKEGAEMILVYEHASRGSLDRMLKDTTLTWSQRLKICLDAAKGLSFLHDPNGKQQRVLHCDVKSANILLDESLNAKVADFGLSKISSANPQFSLLVTSPIGTPGYCDPLYMNTYQLTKESDVYSFGVVLFEVLCGRVCYEKSDDKLKIFVHFWKACYEQEKLDEIIFQGLMPQMDPSSLETFVDIAYQCLQNSREQRPTMSLVVEKLKIANQHQEIVKFKPSEYEEVLNAADNPLIYRSNMELKGILTKGFHVNGGRTFFSINDKEVNCERIYIEGCLNPDKIQNLTQLYDNSRFPGGRCYIYYGEFKASVRAQFLSPEITYKLNLVFARNTKIETYIPLWYRLDGKKKVSLVYDTDRGEDGWFVAPLYQFKSVHKAVHFELIFQSQDYLLIVAGIEFQPLEENVDHYQVLEYQDIVQAASQSLFYKSLEELKVLLSRGVYLNEYKTWFSLNEKGQHCVEISIVDCLIPNENYTPRYAPTRSTCRFGSYYIPDEYQGFKVHIRTQFLSPLTRYTINLLVEESYSDSKQRYAPLKYKLEGETQTSTVYLAYDRKDSPNALAELYQFTSDERVIDLEIVFFFNPYGIRVEGILFQPLEEVTHEQVLEDENLSDDSLQWTMKEENLCSHIWKWFIDNGQEGYSVDKNGKKLLMLSARGVIRSQDMSFKSLPESRFGEVPYITSSHFDIVKKIESDVLSPETTYAIYLVYKLTEDHSILEMSNKTSGQSDEQNIYLVSPPVTPVIGQKLDQNTHKPLNRRKLNAVPRQRSDGWMEVKLSKLQTPRSTETIYMHLRLYNLVGFTFSGLNIQSIELRPIVAHLV